MTEIAQPAPSERPVPERDMPVAANDVPLPVLTLDDLDEDEAWAVVRAAAEDLDADAAAAAGLAPPAGSAERLAAQLTAEEQAELIRLVETELKRSGA